MRSSIVSAEGFSPMNRGRTFSDDPKHPLWKIQVKFPTTKPMLELIKAPTKAMAIQYAKAKYPESEISLLMDTPVRR